MYFAASDGANDESAQPVTQILIHCESQMKSTKITNAANATADLETTDTHTHATWWQHVQAGSQRELPVAKGDVVVVRQTIGEAWAVCTAQGTNASGLLPLACLKFDQRDGQPGAANA